MRCKVKNKRMENQLTQSELASQSQITERHLQKIENGSVVPKISTAIRIADTLGVQDLRELFDQPTAQEEGNVREHPKGI